MRALNLTNSYRNARLGSTRRMAYPIARLAEPRAHLGTVDLRRAIEVCEHAGRNDPIARAFLARKGQCVVGHRPAATFLTAATASLSTLGNIGPGFNGIGATQNYGWFSTPSLALMSLLMMLGRLEVYAVAVLLLPRFWRGN